MTKVEIFWREGCGFCTKVKGLFDKKGVSYVSYNILEDEKSANGLKKRLPNSKTVPQVFINGKHIGGCDDTFTLEQLGELDDLIKG